MSLKEYSLSFLTDFVGQEVKFLRESDFNQAAWLVGQMSSLLSRKNFGKQILKKNMASDNPTGGLVKLMSRRQ